MQSDEAASSKRGELAQGRQWRCASGLTSRVCAHHVVLVLVELVFPSNAESLGDSPDES